MLRILHERGIRREWEFAHCFFVLLPILAERYQILPILPDTEKAVFRPSSSVYRRFPILPPRWHLKWLIWTPPGMQAKSVDRASRIGCSHISGLVESSVRFLAIMVNPHAGGQSLKNGLRETVHFSTWSGAGPTGCAMIDVIDCAQGVVRRYIAACSERSALKSMSPRQTAHTMRASLLPSALTALL
jgi:hypothetical protein